MTTSRASIRGIAGAVADRVAELLRKGDKPVAPEYLTPAQVSQMSGFSRKTLEAYRSRRIGPVFTKVGRHVRYRADDIRAWIEAGGPVK